ncbi:hypothetical protein FACS1894130_03730 [Spirochaetia bacterium]|nr:hypothetical protein FACS1894130_03730 [Spirochaetia bacterium]
MAGILNLKPDKDPAQFWQEYGARYGETVLSYHLGRYLSGWPEHEAPLWGLLIATSGGFRFHHFPQEGWIQFFTRSSGGGEPPKEKTIFIPVDRIVSVELAAEKSLWKRIFLSHPPIFTVRYRTMGETGPQTEADLRLETEAKAEAVAQSLRSLITAQSATG